MSLLELQGLTVETESGVNPPPGSRASKFCNASVLSVLIC
jgi:SapB morphogen precursor RamS